MLVFKIVHAEEWKAAEEKGVYRGSADDKRDNFIHLSTAAQLAGTLNRHFSQATGLMLVALEADDFGDKLKWETNAQGETFPHLYSELEISKVLWSCDIPNKAPGVFVLPARAFVAQPAGRLS